MSGKVERARMEAVPTPTIAAPLQHNCAHIVVQHLLRCAAKREKRGLVRLDQGLDPLVGDKLDIGGPAPAQRRDEHRKPVATAPLGGAVTARKAVYRRGPAATFTASRVPH